MDVLESVTDRLETSGVEGEIWLDGSFVTTKVDPSDIDFILIMDSARYDNDATVRQVVDLLIEPSGEWPPSYADTNVAFRDLLVAKSNFSEVLLWWQQRFGTHPGKGPPKGIVVVRLGEAVG